MRHTSRRQFLGDSLLAAAAAAGAGLGNRARAGQADELPRALGPNDQIRVACIGVNGQGMSHVQAYASLNDAVVATICDIDPKAAAKAIQSVEAKTGKKPRY